MIGKLIAIDNEVAEVGYGLILKLSANEDLLHEVLHMLDAPDVDWPRCWPLEDGYKTAYKLHIALALVADVLSDEKTISQHPFYNSESRRLWALRFPTQGGTAYLEQVLVKC